MGSVARLADAVELIGSESWASKIRKKARSVATTIDAGYMHLAEMLYLIDSTPVNGEPKNGPIYSAWGYTSFAQYAEEELGMHRRRAERLRRIWFDIDIRLADQLDWKLRKRLVALGFGKQAASQRIGQRPRQVAQPMTIERQSMGRQTDDDRRRCDGKTTIEGSAISELLAGKADQPHRKSSDLFCRAVGAA